MLNRLNVLAKNCNLDNINKSAWIVEDNPNLTSTTTIFDKDSQLAFPLNTVTIIKFKKYSKPSIVPLEYKGAVALHRQVISLSALSSIRSELDLFTVLYPVIQAGIIDIINQVGDIDGDQFSLSMKMPDGTFFRESTEFNAYEVRLILYKNI